ncbi:MAG: RNA polymerase sigma factor [Candidatus Eisenbacteria bacterium]|uniref:RNA polymerase sigma factor n=1 Tax=Eiseniibacteriota bacterium TaxID=2212470 RepID=A0A948W6I7_UNCEI|nr:RNA polymerase sigma factor [Candidatus Eisenbacteria bacterium]MBU1948881.1 RNA polymerase sigma factor [Candidatus Eisenbacteria bacterium]MBU2691554.1 RNA polymerase sigma factor [Candidatus Eisenbacteria bacterium]
MEEQRLIADVIAGDAAAERRLYDAHVDRVFRLAYRMAGDEQLAEDFTQETFLKAFRYLPRFQGRSALSTWLHAITMSVVISGLRSRKRRQEHETPYEDIETAGAPGETINMELRVQLKSAIDGLSTALRAVFILHDIEGYKHREIVDILSIPEGTSKARLSRAHETLRKNLSPLGRNP